MAAGLMPIDVRFVTPKLGLLIPLLLSLSPLRGAERTVVGHPVYHHYTANDGLPSNTVYHTFQDSRGFIWFATNNGVSRFDGQRFTNFDMSNGLVDNVVFEIYEDHRGYLWFISQSCQLCYYADGRIEPYAHNDKIRARVNAMMGPVKYAFSIDTLGNVLLSVKQFGLVSISEEGAFRHYTDGQYAAEVLVDFNRQRAVISNRRKSLMSSGQMRMSSGGEGGHSIALPKSSVQQLFAAVVSDTVRLVALNDALYQLCGQGIRLLLRQPSIIIGMSSDRHGNLWLSELRGGVQVYSPGRYDRPMLDLFAGRHVVSVLHDAEGGYWIATLNEGVLYVPNINVLSLTAHDGLQSDYIMAVQLHGSLLYVGYRGGFIDVIDGGKLRHLRGDVNRSVGFVSKFYHSSREHGLFACGNGAAFRVQPHGATPYAPEVKQPRAIVQSRHRGLWMGGRHYLVRVEGGRVVHRVPLLRSTVWSMAEDDGGNLWFCTSNGLYRYDGHSIADMGRDDERLQSKGYSMLFHPGDSMLWIGTNGNGVVLFDPIDGGVQQITMAQGLPSNTVNGMAYHSGRVWLATAQGLSVVRPVPDGQWQVETYTRADGLPSTELTAVTVSGDTVVVGTNSGLAVFSYANIERKEVRTPTHITDVRVNGRSCATRDGRIALGHTQNMVGFSFVTLSYKTYGRNAYRYRMHGVDTAWSYTQLSGCLYSSLAPGSYRFQVQGRTASGGWGDGASIQIDIARPYWQTVWFAALMAALAAGAIFAVYRIRLNAVNRRNDLINSVNLYKHQALRQQMNPHFIFNTLGSIQYYILNNEPIKSQQYLTKFARLMRMTLDNSAMPVVSLSDELELLKLYLYLEDMRLGGRLVYRVECPDLDRIKDTPVPTMIIQPFVENAIWHGIMLKRPQAEGWVRVGIAMRGDHIVIEVEDNGVGRQQAQLLKTQSGRVSRGYQITQQRISLLNMIYGVRFNITTIDKHDDQMCPAGTLVVINVPIGLPQRGA
ncbi:MAG: histidine kinase [Bacteroidales bacterium]|nr:histidine kinase [Bacteroidales bacterium]